MADLGCLVARPGPARPLWRHDPDGAPSPRLPVCRTAQDRVCMKSSAGFRHRRTHNAFTCLQGCHSGHSGGCVFLLHGPCIRCRERLVQAERELPFSLLSTLVIRGGLKNTGSDCYSLWARLDTGSAPAVGAATQCGPGVTSVNLARPGPGLREATPFSGACRPLDGCALLASGPAADVAQDIDPEPRSAADHEAKRAPVISVHVIARSVRPWRRCPRVAPENAGGA